MTIVELRFRYGDSVERHARSPVIYMTQRRRLDAFLLDAARAQGVEVREGAGVAFGDGVRVGGEPVEVDVVVGADGRTASRLARSVSATGIVHGVALEGNVALRPRLPRALSAAAPSSSSRTFRAATAGCSRREITSTSASAPGRPKGRGCASTSSGSAAHGLRPDELTSVRGHRLPLRRPATRIAGERALLVGDAAGLIDPVSGDGMYECFVSASLAASAISDLLAGRSSSLEGYAGAVGDGRRPLHRASWQLKRALDRGRSTSWRIARTNLLWRSVERLLLAELSAPGEQRGLARVPLRGLEFLSRVG